VHILNVIKLSFIFIINNLIIQKYTKFESTKAENMYNPYECPFLQRVYLPLNDRERQESQTMAAMLIIYEDVLFFKHFKMTCRHRINHETMYSNVLQNCKFTIIANSHSALY
jgi:hypothetical protein